MPIQFISQVISKPVMVGSDIQFGSTMYNPTVVWYVPPSTTGRVTDPNRTPPSYNPPAASGGTESATQQVAPGFVVPQGGGGGTSNIVVLCHFNGESESSVIDETGRIWTLGSQGHIDPSVPHSELSGSTASLLIQLSEAYGMRTPVSSDFNFAGGEFSIEAFVRNPSGRIIYMSNDDGDSLQFSALRGGAGPYLAVSSNWGGEYILEVGDRWSSLWGEDRPAEDVWYHIAVGRVGSVFTLYIDGEVVATTVSSISLPSFTGWVRVGN